MGQHIGVALSGGGHRASLFGLGAVTYLLDAGKGPELSTISSISGGSLTNGWLGLEADLTSVPPAEVDPLVRRLAHQVARKGTLWAYWGTYALLAALAAPVVAAIVLTVVFGAAIAWIVWPVTIVLVGAIARLRSRVARASFDSTMLRGRTLDEMHHQVAHVIGATELQTSEQVFFSSRFVYSWRTGVGQTGGLTVAAAAQASAALPGAFTPVSLPLAPHRFPKQPGYSSFLLYDGGVYDNMGDEWLLRAAAGFDEPVDDVTLQPVDEVIVVNSSAAKDVTNRGSVKTPLLGEFTGLLAVKDVMYDQTTALRRRWLAAKARVAAAEGRPRSLDRIALRSAMIQIDRSPYELPDAFARFDDDHGNAAREAITALDAAGGRAFWEAEADANKAVGTTLSKVKADRAAGLLRHAYVLTMINTHVLLGYPLLEIPSVDRSRAWIEP